MNHYKVEKNRNQSASNFVTKLITCKGVLLLANRGKQYLFEASSIENKAVLVSRGVYIIARRIKDKRSIPTLEYYEKLYVGSIPDEESEFQNNGSATIYLYRHCKDADEIREIIKDIEEDDSYQIIIMDVPE